MFLWIFLENSESKIPHSFLPDLDLEGTCSQNMWQPLGGSYRERLPEDGIKAELVESWHRGKKWVLEISLEHLHRGVPKILKFLVA